MPYGKMMQKAGRWSFLLVCLFLCSACGREKAVFQAADPAEPVLEERIPQKPLTEENEEKAEEAKAGEAEPEEKIDCVNINTADAEELMTLPGIGQVRAEAIIADRQSAGAFENIEDIMRVKGIKQGIFSKISSFICVK